MVISFVQGDASGDLFQQLQLKATVALGTYKKYLQTFVVVKTVARGGCYDLVVVISP